MEDEKQGSLSYFERQVSQSCVVHAFNNMVGRRSLTYSTLVTFVRSNPDVYKNETVWFCAVRRHAGTRFSAVLLCDWFCEVFFPKQLVMKSIRQKVYSTEQLLKQVDAMGRVGKVGEVGHTCFLFSTCDHMFAARKIGSTWFLFDSNNCNKVLLDDKVLCPHTIRYIYCIV
jgi:hypothetical protein